MTKTLAQIWREAHSLPPRATTAGLPAPRAPVAGCVRCEAQGADHAWRHVFAGLEPGDSVYRCQGIARGRCDWTGVPKTIRVDRVAVCPKCKRYCVEPIP